MNDDEICKGCFAPMGLEDRKPPMHGLCWTCASSALDDALLLLRRIGERDIKAPFSRQDSLDILKMLNRCGIPLTKKRKRVRS